MAKTVSSLTGVQAMPLQAKNLVVVNIPRSFKVDGKPFTFFLNKNRIDYMFEHVEDVIEYRFLSTEAGDRAARIWEHLTGSTALGRLPSHKTWRDFR